MTIRQPSTRRDDPDTSFLAPYQATYRSNAVWGPEPAPRRFTSRPATTGRSLSPWLAIPVAAAAVVGIAVAAPLAFDRTGDSPSGAATAGASVDASTEQALLSEAYAALDPFNRVPADFDVLITSDGEALNFSFRYWMPTDEADYAPVHEAALAFAAEHGLQGAISEMIPADGWGSDAASALRQTRSTIDTLYASSPEAGYSASSQFDLVDDGPWILVWRTTPIADIDEAAESAAAAAGIKLQILDAQWTQTQLEGYLEENVGEDLGGFTITGNKMTPSGVILWVDGDLATAQSTFAETPIVLAIRPASEQGSNVPL
ncbi:hypothetical protein [Nocardioides zeae]|uniref:Uncharacterized protein n=1 Tax=Nocardioides zeae TaxID=1457234 RepID=A0A6P0HFE9_9ACTN|nr:hypothetical protein [Nocardioides zeae]NEN77439.1 hypothetical protein [Nocardioides zeae]